MEGKIFFGLLSVATTIVGFVPYVRSILLRQTRPHLFTWLVWSILTSIIFAIQVVGKAGPGAWCAGLTALTMFVIIALGFRSGERSGTFFDRVSLLVSLVAIPVWALTKDPTYSAILVTLIDVVAFYPTIAKTYKQPHSENLFYYWIWLIKYPASLVALTTFNVANAVYAVVWTVMGIGFVAMTIYRRRVLAQ